MSEDEAKQTKEMAFEDAYGRLEEICDKLADGDLGLEQTLDLLREGHGIEHALRTRLDSFQKELEEIEAGQGLADVRIVPGADGPSEES